MRAGYFLTRLMNVLAGLNAGMLCAGIMIVVFLEIFLAVFWARFLRMKLPKPRRYTFSPFCSEPFTEDINDSTVVRTVALSMPVVLEISFTISALVIIEILLFVYS